MPAPIIQEELVWGLQAIGDRLGVSNVEAYRRLVAGRVPGERVYGRWVARATDLDRWLAAHRQKVAA